MRILCTGNPEKFTIAWAVIQRWHAADTICQTNGWNLDLSDEENLKRFRSKIADYDVFINSSYIAPGAQKKILETVVEEWMRLDIKGHVFNIGTTLEWEKYSQHEEYAKSKIALRDSSLEFNKQTGITGVKSTYLILGGVNNKQPENSDGVDPMRIADAVHWILTFPERIALLQIDKMK